MGAPASRGVFVPYSFSRALPSMTIPEPKRSSECWTTPPSS